MHKKRSNSAKHIFLRSKKNYRGGIGPHTQELNTDINYPAVYGIDNKTVLYPISKYGEPSGFFDPPVNSNGPDGYGPINGPYLGMGGKRRKTKRSTKKRRSIKKRTTKKRIHKRRMTKKRSSRKFRGGGGQSPLLPQTIINAGRGLMQTVNAASLSSLSLCRVCVECVERFIGKPMKHSFSNEKKKPVHELTLSHLFD